MTVVDMMETHVGIGLLKPPLSAITSQMTAHRLMASAKLYAADYAQRPGRRENNATLASPPRGKAFVLKSSYSNLHC
jgi:hypothetical protein